MQQCPELVLVMLKKGRKMSEEEEKEKNLVNANARSTIKLWGKVG